MPPNEDFSGCDPGSCRDCDSPMFTHKGMHFMYLSDVSRILHVKVTRFRFRVQKLMERNGYNRCQAITKAIEEFEEAQRNEWREKIEQHKH